MSPISQTQRQRQQQKLTPQQLYLLELLGKPVDQIERLVADEVMSNPMLDTASIEHVADDEPIAQQKTDNLLSDEYDEDDEHNYDSYRDYQPSERGSVDERQMPQVVASTSMADSLREQLVYANLNDDDQLIAEEIIGSLDAAGYFDTDPAIIVNDLASQGIYVYIKDINRVLSVVQSLEPAGIAARSAQECLLLQLERLPASTPARATAIAILQRHYELFQNGNKGRIAQLMQLGDEEAQQAFALIGSLTLKPGEGEVAPYLIPDFMVTSIDGRLRVSLARGNMPEVQFDDDYLLRLSQLEQSEASLSRAQREEASFLTEKKRSADMLIDTLRQRGSTLMRVVEAIVEAQHDYFVSGNPADKHPLMQKDIADRTGYDPSTVSRIVGHKYVQTDFGIIPLDECFSTGYTTDDGTIVSTEAIKQIIREAVEGEDPRSPLTDEQIADLLNERGYPIARRTIANYRRDLGIATCHRRRVM